MVISVSLSFNHILLSTCSVAYALGVLSCFIVVLIVAVAGTGLGNVPAIFFRLAESQNGEIDLRITPTTDSNAYGLNYTLTSLALSVRGQNVLNSPSSSSPEARPFTYAEYSSPRMVFPETTFYAINSCNIPSGYSPQNSSWMYTGTNPSATCATRQFDCLTPLCNSVVRTKLLAIDTNKEQHMGVGRKWTLPPVPYGGIYISKSLANVLGITVGDTIVVKIPTMLSMAGVYSKAGLYNITSTSNPTTNLHDAFSAYWRVFVPLRVSAVFSDILGKLGSSDSSQVAIIEYESVLRLIGSNLRPSISSSAKQIVANENPNHYASEILFNLPPPRLEAYRSSDYAKTQALVTGFIAQVLYRIGYSQVDTTLPLIIFMRSAQFFALFLGLIISIIIAVLTILSILLIYSLLMINVETRTFEMGVLRMIGMTQSGLIKMILVQALMYAIPAWVLGLSVASILNVYVVKALGNLLSIDLDTDLDPEYIGIATVMGLFIPVVSSILPMRNALSQNLHDSLDVGRSKISAVKFDITRSEDAGASPTVIIVGACLAIFGFTIYYAFPLALLSVNLSLLLSMFFGLLFGMLLGLCILALNVESMVEYVITRALFWWENLAVQDLVLKNLVAHRPRNRKTTMILQITSISYQIAQQKGARLTIGAKALTTFIAGSTAVRELENVLSSSSSVDSWAWASSPLIAGSASSASTELFNVGRYLYSAMPVRVVAISPSFYTASNGEYLVVYRQNSSSALQIDEQLYTQRGSYSGIIGSASEVSLGAKSLSTDILLQYMDFPINAVNPSLALYKYYKMRPIAQLDASPYLTFSRFPSSGLGGGAGGAGQNMAVSFETYVRLSNGKYKSVDDIPLASLLIRPKDGISPSEMTALKYALNSALSVTGADAGISDLEDSLASITQAETVISFFFAFTTIIAMFLCFFSLTSSMYTNIQEQSKEIGILRSMGVRKSVIRRIFVYESFVLVLSASLTGLFIGAVTSYLSVIQRALFTQLPIPFVFPYTIMITVVVLALIFAFLSSYAPVRSLTNLPTVVILRRLLT